MTVLRGEPLVAGEATGEVVVSDLPLSLWGGLDPETGEVIDRHHPLSGRSIAGLVFSIPCGRGSCSASGVLLEAIRAGTGPSAVILSRADPIIALGAILAEELYGLVVPVVVLPEEDRRRIADRDTVRITRDGTVLLQPPAEVPLPRATQAARSVPRPTDDGAS